MFKVLAIGKNAAVLGDLLEEEENGGYDIFRIGIDETGNEKKSIAIPDLGTNAEKYEENIPDLKKMLQWVKNYTEKLYCIVSGADPETGMVLAVLEKIKKARIEVVYLRPDTDSLSGVGRLHENTIFNVVQEYARSGLFARAWLFDYCSIEAALENVSLINYHKTILETVAKAVYSVDLFREKRPVMSTLSEPYIVDRISTISVLDVKAEKEVVLFPMKLIKEKEYFYSFPAEMLQKNGRVVLEIVRRQEKELLPHEDVPWPIDTSYAIFETNFNNSFAYTVIYSSEIQSGVDIADEA